MAQPESRGFCQPWAGLNTTDTGSSRTVRLTGYQRGGEVCRGVPQACSGTSENLSPRSRLVPSKDEKRENQAVQGNTRGPHLFSRVPCRSRMALVSLWSEELASGNRLCGSDRKHTPHIDAGCMTFRDFSGVIFC